MPKQPYLFERLSKDDPNYELVKNQTLLAWADSHRLVADAYEERGSLPDFFETCLRAVRRGADILVRLEDPSVSGKCDELDQLERQFIRLFSKSLLRESKRFGKANVRGAITDFSRQVIAITTRSKQQICEGELARSAEQQPCTGGPPILPTDKSLAHFDRDCLAARAVKGPTDSWRAATHDTEVGCETSLESSGSRALTMPVGWEDVQILFLSDHRVQIRTGPKLLETLNYAEMGFEDKRNGKPNKEWDVFRVLAQAGGIIPNAARASKDFAAIGKRFERLRKKLKAHFHIDSDPFPLDSARRYCCRFTIGCALAFQK